ncbi:translation initiation factor IF-2 subunit gamma [archaeon]|jgi:translation initiation factor 2 subunit 3|nr:translation initiation factor IF-2 subunit gamma [archaeon]MBT4023141.1 translation initiation factor IF-2 subunit gamma [archaeon]MBT4271856.1 translation initiation factor IF-2 subunit gamma [archaeon]MBT4460744.1 translation initiation factor IF-2 subunit gamma [archaeon]MBT4858332.1 translation initiation factor IF-2 subunit gamma [archaeon]
MAKAKEKILAPEVNIGLVGHVDHGKTTLTECLSGKWTDTHSEELKRGITIRLGYADSVFVKTKDKELMTEVDAKKQKKEYKVLRKVSFVDAPGHESLMATMLAGATLMDGAMLLIAANEECPQPQTREHLMALKISGIKNVVIIQNKIDLVTEEKALENYNKIKEFLKGTDYEDAPIIPISAQHNINTGYVIEAIEKNIPTPKRNLKVEPRMFVARSFDVNKPGQEIKNLKGGVLGGALGQGIIKKGDEVEIRPGHVYEEANKKVWKPITTKVVSMMTGGSTVDEVTPGGSVALLTNLDPSVVKSDRFTGNVVGYPGKLPPVWDNLKLKTNLLERVVGSAEDTKVDALKMGEMLMLNVNSAATVGIISKLSKDVVECKLKLPVCADIGARVTISRRMGTRFRLIGFGIIQMSKTD